MGSLANMLFRILLGWIQLIASSVWSAFTSEKGGSVLKWIGNHWLFLAALFCIAGVTVDLVIYILRWRPIHVWKSFFSRRKRGRNETQEPEYAYEAADGQEPVPGRYFRPVNRQEAGRPPEPQETAAPSPVPEKGRRYAEEDDLQRWQKDEEEPEREIPGARTIITPAGYAVPEDSPYRRPVPAEPEYSEPAASPPAFDGPPSGPEQRTVMSRRRRRLRVGDLFADPEEELQEFEAPQQLIDRNQAYHKPVYPRGWKKSEEEGE